MSIPVEVSGLAAEMAKYRFAYLLSNGDAGTAPHAVAVTPRLEQGVLVLPAAGRRSGSNIQTRPQVALVWPPENPGDYSLIVDGAAEMAADGSVRIRPSRAVLHRPAPAPEPVDPDACGSDCKELELG